MLINLTYTVWKSERTSMGAGVRTYYIESPEGTLLVLASNNLAGNLALITTVAKGSVDETDFITNVKPTSVQANGLNP